ncbi:hypothetical protein EHH44_07450 [Mycolicibacter terrae]|uniref:Uncharacterized protein n=1 Tax=Mycolicibacter terrae TaxID=1788 RepID=A0ACD2EQ96_9MYCO|nr:hypothetical protein [Mycolicibacter terrae]RRR46645.1 hypothetical protein EHH44_07450 [Mycolicibacter terrae]
MTGVIGRRPADAAAFVEFVQDTTNAYLPDVIFQIYAPDARLVMIADGAREESVGLQAIHTAWARSCAVFEARRFRLSKRLVAATDDTIVNEWWGGPHGRHDGCGIEVWRFDPQSKVRDVHVYSFLKVRSTRHPLQVLQLSVSSPGTVVAFGRAALRRRTRR